MQTAGISFLLGPYQNYVANALDKMSRGNIAARIWANDFHVWKPSPAEIANRMGWLHAPVETSAHVGEIRASVEPFTSGGISDVVLLGMGGSSLSAEVFSSVFGSAPGFPRLQILDTTDPVVIRRAARGSTSTKPFSSFPPSPAGRWRSARFSIIFTIWPTGRRGFRPTSTSCSSPTRAARC